MPEILKELPEVRVKFLSRCRQTDWSLHLPASKSSMKNCHFIFDPEERNYDCRQQELSPNDLKYEHMTVEK